MNIIDTDLNGVLIIEPKVFRDSRGFFMETFQSDRYAEIIGNELTFVQDNHSRSTRGVLRGLHFQMEHPQGKLVRVARGVVFDVAVDIDPGSKSFGCYTSAILSEENFRQMYIPPGFAHGFQVLSAYADFEYKCTDLYYPDDQGCIRWDDPTLEIDWPINNPDLSLKDQNAQSLDQYARLAESTVRTRSLSEDPKEDLVIAR